MSPLRPAAASALALCAVLLLSACGSAAPDSGTAGPSTSAAPSATGAPTSGTATTDAPTGATTAVTGPTRSVTVTGTSVTPTPDQVDLAVGQTLTVTVTSDHTGELHAHGFEVEAPLVAGTPTTVRLTGTEPGVYEVETHDPSLLLFTVAVR